MSDQLAFFFDASACSGCKTCQMACKDKHNLNVGRLWRRVYEISGGTWLPSGESWNQDVFAYNISIACNHCLKPICVEVCPTQAMHKRSDGIVLVDQSKCIGCRYCQWSCPYSAPQRDESIGKMSKCHFCLDEIEKGRPPACIAACPMRALDYGPLNKLRDRYGDCQVIHPMPQPEVTRPALIVRPHRDAVRAESSHAGVANLEEVQNDR